MILAISLKLKKNMILPPKSSSSVYQKSIMNSNMQNKYATPATTYNYCVCMHITCICVCVCKMGKQSGIENK